MSLITTKTKKTVKFKVTSKTFWWMKPFVFPSKIAFSLMLIHHWYWLWATQWHFYFFHDDVTKWKHFPRYWPFVRGIYPSPVNTPHKGQWRGALMFSLICVWTNGWVNHRDAGNLIRHGANYDVTAMSHDCRCQRNINDRDNSPHNYTCIGRWTV